MRIAIDCRYVRERPSGIGRYVQALVDRVPWRAPETEMVLWAHPLARRPLSEAPNVSEVVVHAKVNNLPWLWFPRQLAPLDGIDLLHAPSNVLPRSIGCRSVVTIHDLMWLETPELCEHSRFKRLFKTPFYQSGLMASLEQAARIVAISEATADSIARVFPRATPRVRVIPHGVAKMFKPADDPDAAVARCREMGIDRPFLLTVGQDAPYKNQRAIVEAFARAEAADVVLVMVHRLSKYSSLSERAREHGVSKRVVWLDRVGPDDLVSLMQATLALVQFSHCEGFGMPALEAMACGAPVIASDIPALSEVLGPAGVRVPLSISALSDAMGRLSKDASWRADLRALGLERAKSFSWDRCADAHVEVYREALNA